MDYIITESQIDKLHNFIRKTINHEMDNLRSEAEEWGLGEMDDIDEIDSIDRIKVNRISLHSGTKVYIDIHSSTNRDDYNNVRAELQYRLSQWIPDIKLFINDIIH